MRSVSIGLSFFLMWAGATSALGGSAPPATTSGISHAPIVIGANSDFTAANGITAGTGTQADPYVIEGWTITPTCEHGIAIHDTNAYVVVRDVTVATDPQWGAAYQCAAMNLTRASNVSVFRVNVPQGVDGIEVLNSTAIQIVATNITDFQATSYFLPHGVYVSGSTAVEVRDSRLPNVVSYRSSQVRMRGNTITTQLLITESDSVDVEDNVIAGPAGPGGYYATLQVLRSTRTTIRGNTLLHGGFDVEGYLPEHYVSHAFGPDNEVHGKAVRFLTNLSNAAVDATNLGQVLVLNCTNVSVAKAFVEDMEYGLDVAYSRAITIRDARIVNHGLVGLYVRWSQSLTVVNSTFSGPRYGLYLSYVDGALIYHNDFLGNVFDVAGDYANLQLDNGYPAGGNYWDSYRGVDRCRGAAQMDCTAADGIGDTMHNVTFAGWTIGVDRYPLMAQVHPPAPPATNPSTDGMVLNVALLITVACGVSVLGIVLASRRRFRRRPGGPEWPPD